jgi:hypothetical protein
MVVELPYDTTGGRVPGSMAPATYEQWAHDFALTQANKLANGTIDGSEGGLFSNASFAKFGLGTFDPSDIGSGMVSGAAYNQIFELGMKLAQGGYSSLTPQQKQGMSDPTGLRKSTPSDSMTDNDKNNLTDLAIANLQESGATARNAADIAARMSIAQLQEAGASARNAAQIAADLQIAGMQDATDRYGIDTQAAVNREDIAARERIAAADVASREKIAEADRTESGRQFDLGLAEDRRQFNSSLMLELFDRGIALMQNPVDWLGYQYWVSNLGAPLNALALSSAASIAGAVPPSGPSSAGPMIGGPAVLDGDTADAESLGITDAGPVSVSEAIRRHPGGEVTGDAQIAATNTIMQYGSPEEVDAAVSQARMTELPGQASDAYVQQSQQVAQVEQSQAAATQLARTGQAVTEPGPGAPGTGQPADPYAQATGDLGRPPIDSAQALPPVPAMPMPASNPADPNAMAPATGELRPPPVANPLAPAPGNPAQPMTPEQMARMAAAQPAPAPAAAEQPLTNLAGGGNTGGVYTGNEAGGTEAAAVATPASAAGVAPVAQSAVPGGTDTSNIEQLLGQLAANLGIPIEQLRALFPANLMPGAASNSAIENSPVINMLRTGTPVGQFNTQPISPGNPFTSIAAPTGGGRIETGIRGGQDVNASNYLTALPSTREQIQGVIKAQGQYIPDFNEQIMRSAPLTNLSSGSYGRRRFVA